MVVAPATASTIGKMAHGVADNMLVTTYLAMKAPLFVAPAMDLDMFAHPSTSANLDILRKHGNIIIEPTEGELASQLVGKGRMEEPENIVAILKDFFAEGLALSGKTVLITAGPTYEKIDPVRFIGNYSSGKMGFAIAEECANRGAKVKLVAGPVALPTPKGDIERIDVESAAEMYDATSRLFVQADIAILSAAVADFTPEVTADTKIKRTGDSLTLALRPTRDIAKSLGAVKRDDQLLIGFALETDHEEENARAKMERKNLDMIILNSLQDPGAGFRVDTNKVTIITKTAKETYPLMAKREVAVNIVNKILECSKR